MRVDYGSGQRKNWRYLCPGKRDTGQTTCWSVPGPPIDAAVEEIFLSTMVPAEIDLSLAVQLEAEEQARSLEAQWQARLEQVRYEARRAERRYKAVDPENRVVARTLECEWEARLRDLEDVERQYQDARRVRRVDLTEADREQLRAIARDLPAVWRAQTTTAADRKAMLRLVIEIVALEPVDLPRRMTRLRVQWHSGVVDERFLERPLWGPTEASVVEQLRALVAQGLDDEQVAERLNAAGLRTGKQRCWTRAAVARIRVKEGLEHTRKALSPVLPDCHPESGLFSIPGAARRFGVSYHAVRHWVARGLVRARRERFGRYLAWWLEIDENLAAMLEGLATGQRRR